MYCKGGELMNLQEILDEKQMTMYRLSKEARVSFTTISEICSGNRKDIKLDTAIKIGYKQYLVYASGYDTSSIGKNIKCFEIERPEMIRKKD